MRSLFLTTWIALQCLVAAGNAEHTVTSEFSVVRGKIEQIVKRFGKNDVLVVFDLDNTLLSMSQEIGSDQWFDWQDDLLKTNPDSSDLVAKSFPGLLTVQGRLFAISEMHPPETNLPIHVQSVQKTGCSVIVLTARGWEFLSDAVLETADDGYDFRDSAIQINENRGRFLPYDLSNPEKFGLSDELIKRLHLGEPREVAFSDGIYTVAGQHRGAMLRSLLSRSSQSFKAICHVDDEPQYCEQVMSAYDGTDVQVFTFHYSRTRGEVAKFNASTKPHVIKQWKRIRRTHQEVFAEEKE